ncbi:MAG: hypothetical protein NVSMB9_17720 [Isosphaeraceae bacterium]
MANPSLDRSGMALSLGVACVALLLLVWQRIERQADASDRSREGFVFNREQSWRRRIVALVMFLLSGGIFFGARAPHVVSGRPNPTFVWIWLAVAFLILFLMVLALLDWLATRRYAIQRREAIVREGIQILRDKMQFDTRGASEGKIVDDEEPWPGP